jgi:hypothetical protein
MWKLGKTSYRKVGELEGANHPVSPNDPVAGFSQLPHKDDASKMKSAR